MKTRLIDFLKKLGKAFISFVGILLIVVMFMTFMVAWGITVNFVYAHQWIVLIPDLSCIMLLALALRKNVHKTFDTTGKKLFYVIFLNIALLIFVSFGAIWNFAVMLFLLWPMAIGLNQLLKKTFKEIFWWLVDYSDRISIASLVYAVTLGVFSGKGILVAEPLKTILILFGMFFLAVSAILFTTEMFFERKIPVKSRKVKTKKR